MGRWVLISISTLIVSFILVMAVVVIPGGHRGVVFSQTRGVEQRVLGEGMSVVIPLVESVNDYDVQRHTVPIEMGKGNAAASSDVQDVFVKLQITYRPLPEKVNVIWQEVGGRDALEQKILTPETVQVLKAVIPQYVAADIVTKREDIRTKALDVLNQRPVVDRYLEVFSIVISNVDFQPEFRTLLEQKAQKTQQLEIAKRDVEIAQQTKLKQITLAEGEANSKKVVAEAEAFQNRVLARTVSARSLESRRVDVLATLAGRWQGNFPGTWMNFGGGGAPLPLFNIDALMKDLQSQQPDRVR